VVVETVVTNIASVSIEIMNGAAGNEVSDVTVMDVPDVSVIAAPNVVLEKFLWFAITAP
jgi:hypothetical protein